MVEPRLAIEQTLEATYSLLIDIYGQSEEGRGGEEVCHQISLLLWTWSRYRLFRTRIPTTNSDSLSSHAKLRHVLIGMHEATGDHLPSKPTTI